MDATLLEMRGISKSFPGVRALQDVSLEVLAGEVHALVGENRAGLGLSIDPRRRVGTLTVAEQQLVEIAKALSADAELVVMDEPTAALTVEETERLFRFIRDLRARGVGIIYITHRLEEIFKIADRVTVLRDGQRVGTYTVAELTMDELIRLMVGRQLTEKFPKADVPPGSPVLDVRGLTRQGLFRDISFVVHRGEILGIAGLIGSGKAEVAHAIFGAGPLDAGEILLDGQRVIMSSPADAIALGVGRATEDRKRLGLVLPMSVRANITLPVLRRRRTAFVVRRADETAPIRQAIPE